MIINATQVREGMIIHHEGELYRVTKTMHRTPGKGDACVQTKLKNISNDKNLEHRFRSNDKVDKAELETVQMQYLYADPTGFIFMDMTDYEQKALSDSLVGDAKVFLVESEMYSVVFYDGQPVGLELPLTMDLKVIEAPPAIKKATATSQTRPVTLENGMSILAPTFIKEGDVVRVNTQTQAYQERV